MKQTKLSKKAYDWAIRLQAGDIRERELDDYVDWLENNPEEAEGVEELRRLWDELAVAEIPAPASMQEQAFYRRPVVPRMIEFLQMFFTPVRSVAFSLLVAFIGICSIYLNENNLAGITYQTARAEMTTVKLADGSTAHMNVLSTIKIDFTDSQRHIILEEGEVSFNVIPDTNRPFVVSVDDSEVYALGTEFNVKINQGRTLDVTLVDGKIRVTTNLNAADGVVSEVLSEPGDHATILPIFSTARTRYQQQTAIEISSSEIEKSLSWRQEKLIFEGESLEDAIQEINRHTTHTLRLLDPSLGQDMKVFGVFNTGDWEGFVSGIETSYPLRGERVRPDLTVLRPIASN
jgi:transmembrane sensor